MTRVQQVQASPRPEPGRQCGMWPWCWPGRPARQLPCPPTCEVGPHPVFGEKQWDRGTPTWCSPSPLCLRSAVQLLPCLEKPEGPLPQHKTVTRLTLRAAIHIVPLCDHPLALSPPLPLLQLSGACPHLGKRGFCGFLVTRSAHEHSRHHEDKCTGH